jgi:hypothetical protein
MLRQLTPEEEEVEDAFTRGALRSNLMSAEERQQQDVDELIQARDDHFRARGAAGCLHVEVLHFDFLRSPLLSVLELTVLIPQSRHRAGW